MPEVFDLEAIRSAVDESEVVDAVEQAFVAYSRGLADIPPVGLLHFDDPPGDVHIKYGVLRGDDAFVVKVASGFYENPSRGLPTSDGVMLVFEAATGRLGAVLLDEGWLTELRTGAAGAVAARHLAPPIERIGMIGAGVQGRFQLRALARVTDCRDVLVWSRSADRAAAYRDELSQEGWEISIAATPSEVAAASDLVVTATPAQEPVLFAADVRPGIHITALGSDNVGKQELDAQILGIADVVVADSVSQATHHGECAAAIAAGAIEQGQIVELGQVIADPGLGRTSPDQITVADLTGVAVQDIAVARMAYRALVG
ncbi:MAG TPA: NAD(P)-binding domain-containing protein [Acidimicrobiia bacterium]|nr:NAD(P)-binding domain-containing protein [Acidimicrobiia bacterium]